MKIVNRHTRACITASSATFEEFGSHGPFQPESEEHAFWLLRYDEAISEAIHKEGW